MKTKYPIILVHGMAIKDFLFVKSFGDIDRILRVFGFTVYKSKVDAFGTIEDNAAALKEEILEILKKENVDKVNLIGHSKGGLDSKYMITNYGMENHVASLTTLCTPHRGSPLASGILTTPKWILKFLAFWVDLFYKIIGDKKPNSFRVCEQLALVNSIEEETFGIPSTIYCQSYSTTLKRSRDDFIMGIPLIFTRYFNNGNDSDGCVTKESAAFGDYKGNAFDDDSISHSQITDFMAKRKDKDKICAFYSSLCEDLAKRGL